MTPIFRPQCPDFLLPFYDLIGAEFPTDSPDLKQSVLRPVERHFKRLRSILVDTFEARCCYCEIYADQSSSGVIERFRPRGSPPVNETKRPQSSSYWHLQFDWRNLYWACATCNRYKADRFPLFGESRPLDYGTIRSSNMRSPSFLILAMTTLMNIYDFWRMDLSKV